MTSFRVVCIEDEPDMIELMRLLLTRRGFEFFGARNGQDGLSVVARANPHLILLDLMMPDMDGWQVYEKLKQNEVTRSIPVIVVTARAQANEQVLALRVNKVDDFITKPFGPAQLINSIERVLAQRASPSRRGE